MSPPCTPLTWRPRALGLGGAALGLAFSLLRANTATLQPFDERLLLWASHLRQGWLNRVFVDLTALGSTTVATLHSLLAAALLLVVRDRWAAAQLAAASTGAGLLSFGFKRLFERERPAIVPHLVEASGFSFPSGHSTAIAATALTLALVASRHLASPAARTLAVALAAVVSTLVAASRVYLGVHYPSDSAGGVCLGTSAALLLAAAFGWLEQRGLHGTRKGDSA